MFNSDEIYNVSEFINLCKNSIERNIPYCWLQGEISNLSKPYSGHWYFSIKDNKSSLRCALFRLNQRNVKYELKNGMSVIVQGATTLYANRGEFQLIVQKIEPNGIGGLQIAFEQLKNKLLLEGLFNAENKIKLPKYVKSVAIVSSKNGAVVYDIINIIKQRFPIIKINIYDTIVQGQEIQNKIINAIKAADRNDNNEVIILARGGGSIEDLWSFNDESLARTISCCKKPIISAIGHEINTTIADFVADIKASTPTAAAVMIAPNIKEVIQSINDNKNKLYKNLDQKIQEKTLILKQLNLRIINPKKDWRIKLKNLNNLKSKLIDLIKNLLVLKNNKIKILSITLNINSPTKAIEEKIIKNISSRRYLCKKINIDIVFFKKTLQKCHSVMHKNMNDKFNNNKTKLLNNTKNINILSPLSTLLRGYSITKSNKKILKDINEINIDEEIITILNNGEIISKVCNKRNNNIK